MTDTDPPTDAPGPRTSDGRPLRVDAMAAEDWPRVREIYVEGIATGNATFEMEAPGWEAWDAAHLPGARLVARADGGEIVGWAALSPVSRRAAYAGVAEVSVYVAAAHRGVGVGRWLLERLVEASEEAGIWTLQAGIFPENRASVEAHRACGFHELCLRERIGRLNGEWRDVVLMERRSRVAGAD